MEYTLGDLRSSVLPRSEQCGHYLIRLHAHYAATIYLDKLSKLGFIQKLNYNSSYYYNGENID